MKELFVVSLINQLPPIFIIFMKAKSSFLLHSASRIVHLYLNFCLLLIHFVFWNLHAVAENVLWAVGATLRWIRTISASETGQTSYPQDRYQDTECIGWRWTETWHCMHSFWISCRRAHDAIIRWTNGRHFNSQVSVLAQPMSTLWNLLCITRN